MPITSKLTFTLISELVSSMTPKEIAIFIRSIKIVIIDSKRFQKSDKVVFTYLCEQLEDLVETLVEKPVSVNKSMSEAAKQRWANRTPEEQMAIIHKLKQIAPKGKRLNANS